MSATYHLEQFVSARRERGQLTKDQRLDREPNDLHESPEMREAKRAEWLKRKGEREDQLKGIKAREQQAADNLVLSETTGEQLTFSARSAGSADRMASIAAALGGDITTTDLGAALREARRIGREPSASVLAEAAAREKALMAEKMAEEAAAKQAKAKQRAIEAAARETEIDSLDKVAALMPVWTPAQVAS